MPHTFQEVAAAWKADKRPWIKPSTYATYVQLTNHHILPRFGTEQALDDNAVQDFVNSLLQQGLSVKTVRDTMLVLRMILRFGSEAGAWPPLSCKVRYPTATQAESSPTVLSRSQQRRLMDHLKKHFSFQNLGILICLHSGLRIGEVCALQWRDLDMSAGLIHVTKTVQRICLHDTDERAYYLSVDRPKTPSSVRDIPITHELKALLKPLRKIMQEEYYVVSNAEDPLEPRYFRDYYHRILQQLGLPRSRFHALRHTFATRCIESKCDYKTVSAILGHASIATTMDLYVHPGLDEKKKAVEQMLRRLVN